VDAPTTAPSCCLNALRMYENALPGSATRPFEMARHSPFCVERTGTCARSMIRVSGEPLRFSGRLDRTHLAPEDLDERLRGPDLDLERVGRHEAERDALRGRVQVGEDVRCGIARAEVSSSLGR